MDIAETTSTGRRRTVAGLGFALAGAGCLLTVAAFVLDATDTARSGRALAITVHVLCVALPIALGLFRLTRRRDDRFALLLIGTGAAWSVCSFAQSSDPTLYSIGRAGVWVVEVMIVYLLLAFPEGRLKGRADRRVFGAVGALCAGLYLPSALLAEFPLPSPYTSCGSACPHNVFVIGDGAEGLVKDVMQPLREALTLLLFAGVAVILIRRARRG